MHVMQNRISSLVATCDFLSCLRKYKLVDTFLTSSFQQAKLAKILPLAFFFMIVVFYELGKKACVAVSSPNTLQIFSI